MRVFPFLIVLGATLSAASSLRADERIGSYGRWQLETGELPDKARFFMLRAAEVTGEPSRFAVSCASGQRVPYFSHTALPSLTRGKRTEVSVGIDGQEEIQSVMHAIGNLAFLGESREEHQRLINLMHSALDVVTIKIKDRAFVFTATGLKDGMTEMDRRCEEKSAAAD
jgi:hypothetical protein